jgi:acetyltransferase-like isoleucine patch superfamily enzyme
MSRRVMRWLVSMIKQRADSAKVHESCIIEANVHLYGPVKLAERVWLEPNVTIYGPALIGKGTYVGPGSVLGFPNRKELDEMLHQMDREPRFIGGVTRIGEFVNLRSNCVIYSGATIGDRVRFGHNVMIREQVTIGDDTLVGTNVIIDGSCKIGRNVSIQTNVYISTHTVVEDHVFLGPCSILTNDKYVSQAPYELKGPIIRKGASIGANVTVLPGIEVGEGAVVGAGAVVTKNVPSRIIVAGVPAVKLKDVPKTWGLR